MSIFIIAQKYAIHIHTTLYNNCTSPITTDSAIHHIPLVVLNQTEVHNRNRLLSAVGDRPRDTPLVTVSNHHSCFDDPGIWAILPLRYLCNTLRIRWGMAAHDICFTKYIHARFFMYGTLQLLENYNIKEKIIYIIK